MVKVCSLGQMEAIIRVNSTITIFKEQGNINGRMAVNSMVNG